MSSGCWRALAAAAERLMGATLPLSLLALVIWLVPACGGDLQLNPGGARLQEFWRVFTCHFAHWSWSHLAWDVAMFVVLGMLCERLGFARFLACLGSGMVAIPVVVGLVEPGLIYRGLSGLDSALFGLLAALLLRAKIAARDRAGAALVIAMVAAFAAKVTYEYATAGTLFADGGNMVPVPLAHVVGAAIGLGCGCFGPSTAAKAGRDAQGDLIQGAAIPRRHQEAARSAIS